MKHVRKGQQVGGHPADAGSTEWVQWCGSCGVEADDDNRNGECQPAPDELYIGLTVLYALEGGESAPAVVTKVVDAQTVNLRVLLDVTDVDRGEVPEYWTREWLERTGYCPPECGVKFDPLGEGGTWRYILNAAPVLLPYEG